MIYHERFISYLFGTFWVYRYMTVFLCSWLRVVLGQPAPSGQRGSLKAPEAEVRTYDIWINAVSTLYCIYICSKSISKFKHKANNTLLLPAAPGRYSRHFSPPATHSAWSMRNFGDDNREGTSIWEGGSLERCDWHPIPLQPGPCASSHLQMWV